MTDKTRLKYQVHRCQTSHWLRLRNSPNTKISNQSITIFWGILNNRLKEYPTPYQSRISLWHWMIIHPFYDREHGLVMKEHHTHHSKEASSKGAFYNVWNSCALWTKWFWPTGNTVSQLDTWFIFACSTHLRYIPSNFEIISWNKPLTLRSHLFTNPYVLAAQLQLVTINLKQPKTMKSFNYHSSSILRGS